mmetsp:Transcript_15074/g.38322  ORF Transcript_15074/g.38322 Transcript_15074/m.38322 type:complete len:758 (+) Transcript_15074:324-2597(+)|eukprot:CAMPEP_0198236226 /NCGR_PEP_ID=MMETSP1446-20131203/2122_1 /TAXON_ID=1461542 ORGANISM="Unidentified sp, Strain CCMP2111" /NCGR_SAMPLE_ID=MMETSP1446 /ASSEMBLY_ACC=CAM_ASM_001112 /LENGTH=757 /DNA_ID=CAMNT_0043917873 /DNA_START=232 /DNA_END=2505 /DNA_ORIENTATION=+
MKRGGGQTALSMGQGPRRRTTAGFVLLLLVLMQPLAGVQCQVARGRVDTWQVREASGLSASRKHKGVLYTHNDSGDWNRIFAINEWGQHLATYTINGASSRDWEDIAMGPGPKKGSDYLYIGDIGDNRAYYATKVVYRVEEPVPPKVPSRSNDANYALDSVEKFEFKFPGHAGNANSETLMVDPNSGDLYIVRKTRDHPLQVFVAKAPLTSGSVIELEEYHTTCVDYTRECRDEHHNSPSKGELVGGDISPSGLGLLIKSYSAVYYWRRASINDSFFSSDPRVLPYMSERQGEAICWDASEKGYFTLSEGASPMLYYYPYQPHERWLENVRSWNKAYGIPSVSDRQSEVKDTGGSAFSWADMTTESKGWLLNDHIVSSDECSNIPDGSGESCYHSALRGKCHNTEMLAYNFCQRSCKRCDTGVGSPRSQSRNLSQGMSGTGIPKSIGGAARNTSSDAISLEAIPVDEWWLQWLGGRSSQSPQTNANSGWFYNNERNTCNVNKNTGQYSGPTVVRESVSNPSECCTLCSQVNDEGFERCDTWNFCDDGLGCGRYPYGTCILKRSLTYELIDNPQWASGAYNRQSSDKTIVLGVQSGPQKESINWPTFFDEYADDAWRQSMYLSPMNRSHLIGSGLDDADGDDYDWLCQEDASAPGVLECPERKCHALRGTYRGLIVAELPFPSVAQCCEACTNARQYNIPPHQFGCDIYSFCPNKEGCGLMQPYGTCLLKVVSEDPQLGLAWAFNPMEPFTSGRIQED